MEQVHAILKLDTCLVNRVVYDCTEHYSFLWLASKNCSPQMAQVLIEAKANVNQQCYKGTTPLVMAACNGRDKLVQLLLQQPEIAVDLADDMGNTPLIVAAANGHAVVVRQLLDAKASVECVNDQGDSALTDAVESTALVLLERKADVNHVNKHGLSCLFYASRNGREKVAAALLAANADVNLTYSLGATSLSLAAVNGHVSTVQVLIAAGADVNQRTKSKSQRTALHDACHNGTHAIVDALLRAGADPNACTADGQTPLMLAAKYGNTSCLNALLKAKADINAVTNEGDTSLIHAIRANQPEATECLLANGADWLIKGKQSARQLASEFPKKYEIAILFHCAVCGWNGRCCPACRKKYCVVECDKYSGQAACQPRSMFSQCRVSS